MGLLSRAAGSFGGLFKSTGVAGTSTVYFGDGWFQKGYTTPGSRESIITFSAVYACVQTIAQDVAKLPLKVFKTDSAGGNKVEVRNGPLTAAFENPNHYQTWMQFITQVLTSLLYRGNSYIYVDRNGRNDPTDMYPLQPDRVSPWLANDGSVFYSINDVMRPDLLQGMIPARNVIHLRFHTILHPLIGVSPLSAAGYSASAGLNMLKQSQNFFQRMARPSGILKTPNTLKEPVINRLRAQWEEFYGGENTGRVAVLESGLEWQTLTMSAVDAQLIEQLRWTINDVARIFRIPSFMLGELDKATYNNAETLMRMYLNQCLSFYIHLIENAFNTFFKLSDQNMFVKFDVNALMRMEFNLRIEALAKAVQGGIYKPNEAREYEDLNPVAGGDQLFMQYQMTPIDKLGQQPPAGTGAPPPAKGLEYKPSVELADMISRNLRAKLPARV